jgi:hypothetical protein
MAANVPLDEQAEALLSKVPKLHDHTPIVAELESFGLRVQYFFLVWAVKIYIALQIAYLRFFRPASRTRPTLVKTYHADQSFQFVYFSQKLDSKETQLPFRCTSTSTVEGSSHAMHRSTTLSVNRGASALGWWS